MANSNLDKHALRTLSEKYLAQTILEKDILDCLKLVIPKSSKIDKRKITQLLSDRTGKSKNTIYKNTNEYTNYSAVSLLRYWQAMKSLCIDHNVPPEDIPSIDFLLTKYEFILEWINQIAIEDDLTILVDQHPDIVIQLYDKFKDHLNNNSVKLLTTHEKNIMKEIEQHPIIQQKLNIKKDAQIERMNKK